jgi:hypothetical protein
MAEQTTHTGRLLTFQQVAEKWNCSPRTVTRKVERGKSKSLSCRIACAGFQKASLMSMRRHASEDPHEISK